jgi:hypothetical protein
MKYRGIVYDVGLRFTAGQPLSVEPFDPSLAAHDINVIASELHANAIRIEGEKIDRLIVASRIAHEAGLTIFFNPWKMNVPVTELEGYFAEAAQAAEVLRKEGADIVFVAGCEMTLFNEGIFEGASIAERMPALVSLAQREPEDAKAWLSSKSKMLNDALRAIVKVTREEFGGPVTYSAGMWEQVDWSIFDIVGVDHYRANETADHYVKMLDSYRIGKPLIVMEFGCCAYEGAGMLGAGGFMRLHGVNPDGTGIYADGIVPTRSEREQSDYVAEQFGLLAGADVTGVFVYVFSFPTFPHGEAARDLDMMSFSLVKTYPKGHPLAEQMPPWERKEAFRRVAGLYGAASKLE